MIIQKPHVSQEPAEDVASLRVCWITDPHLDANDILAQSELFAGIRAARPDIVVISGDISNPFHHKRVLDLFENKPWSTYFVLGNHDFYFNSINVVRQRMREWNRTARHARWLTGLGCVELTPRTALIGHENWNDARCGDFLNSPCDLNDYHLINDLKGLDRAALYNKLNSLGDEAAAHIDGLLGLALKRYGTVIVLTHVPPCTGMDHKGLEWKSMAPHYASFALGQVLKSHARRNSRSRILVFSGHTHTRSLFRYGNLTVETGSAEYGRPRVNKILLLSNKKGAVSC